jgi:hypothetical protein
MELRHDGVYSSTFNLHRDTDYLLFYPRGEVIYGRSDDDLRQVLRWLGRGENAYFDGQGRYSLEGNRLDFVITTIYTHIEHSGTLGDQGLELHLRWGKREKRQHYTFHPVDFALQQSQNTEELQRSANLTLEPASPNSTAKQLEWWRLAGRRGWVCKRCAKVVLASERECYFETGYCNPCSYENRVF